MIKRCLYHLLLLLQVDHLPATHLLPERRVSVIISRTMFHLASSSASQLYYRTMLWSGTLYALIPLLFLSASATPSEAFRSLPRQIRYEKIHNYIQPHWETERYGIHEVPEELEGYFSITPSGEPWFSDLVQQTLFAACAVASVGYCSTRQPENSP